MLKSCVLYTAEQVKYIDDSQQVWEVAGGVEGGEGVPCEGVRGAEPQTRWEEEGEELYTQ